MRARHDLSFHAAEGGRLSVQVGESWPLGSGSVARLGVVGLGTAALSEAARVLASDGLIGFVSPLAPTEARSAQYCDLFEALRDPYQPPLMTEIDWRLALEQVGLFLHSLAWVGVVRWLGVWAAEAACSDADIERLRTLILQAPPEIKDWYGCAAGAGWSRYADIRLTVPHLIGWAGRAPSKD